MSPTSPKAQISTCSPPSVHTSTHYHPLLGVKRPQNSEPDKRAGNHLSPVAEVGLLGPRSAASRGLPAAKPRERPEPLAGQSGARQPGAN